MTSECTQSNCVFWTGKIAKVDYLTVGTTWLFNNSLSFPYTGMNICSKHITQIKLFTQICCLENILNTVVNTTRQQSCSVTEYTILHGDNFKSFFTICSSTNLAMPDTLKNRKCYMLLFSNNRYLVLPTQVLEILKVVEVSTPCISTFLQNHSRLGKLDFKLLEICF